MRHQQTPIFTETIRLNKALRFAIRHLPRDLKYSVGIDIRHTMHELIRDIVRANMDAQNAQNRKEWILRAMADFGMLEVMIWEVEDETQNGEPIVSEAKQAELGTHCENIQKQLQGWLHSTTARMQG